MLLFNSLNIAWWVCFMPDMKTGDFYPAILGCRSLILLEKAFCYCLKTYLPTFIVKTHIWSVIVNPRGDRKLLPPSIFIATDVPPKNKGNQTSPFHDIKENRSPLSIE